ncbi:O-succinylbenzoate synthase [Agromyces flavus]|uniref:o-succinylbenzoate synthase n=1 Tax=Agromyces flavus TaxID=589382 RepID=A0A1H1VC59_9MICO|nr:o-succinylbenzoate synthase [Agromyces flavus]MCP2365898.1 O-succinylbenzoate synthase [Agromyces flavus]GGI43601.1 o-succinylbenzoate synthase [Agromyces flavus]SDS82362.1 O-succinylbenzoate synthase [Agromyces flavus]
MTTASTPKIEAIELHRLEVPLVRPFETSFGRETAREVLLVRVRTDQGDGWGECVAGRDPFYSSEYVDGAASVIEHYFAPALMERPAPHAVDDGHVSGVLIEDPAHSAGIWVDDREQHVEGAAGPAAAGGATASIATVPLAASLAPALAFVAGHRMAKGALEAAVLEAELRAQGRSMGECFGAVREWVDCGVSVGIAPTIEELLDEVTGYLEQGYRRIKLKIKPGWDLVPVAAVRELLGRDALLQVDANTAYTADDIPLLASLDPFELLLIEQPFAEEDLATHVRLAEAATTPVCLDESILDVTTAVDAIERGAASIVNIKPGRMGGYLEALRVHDACRAREVPVWCGGMLETGVGRAANVALAALPGFVLPGDTSASARYFADDLTEPFMLGEGEHRGQLRVPDGAGTGVHVREELVRDWASSAPVTITAR